MNHSLASVDTTDNTPILDSSLFAEARATMRDKFPRIVMFFLEDSESYIQKIEEGFQASNAELMIPPAHTLKSSAYQMGACKLSEVSKIIETQAKDILKNKQDLASLKAHVESLRAIFAATDKVFKGSI